MIRKTLLAVAAAAALFCVSTSAFAQGTVDEIIAKNLAAKGGVEKIKAVQSIRSTGTMTAQGQSVVITAMSKRPNLSRQEMTVMGQTIVMAFDGAAARMINPMVGPGAMDMPAEQVEMIKDQSDMDGPLVDYKAKGSTIELVGNVTVEGKTQIHLRIARKSLPVQDVYLDSATFLEARIATNVPGSGVIETQLGDYRAVEGMMMPFSVKTVAAGMSLSEMKLDKIEINPKLDDALFKIR